MEISKEKTMYIIWIIGGIALAVILSILCPTDGEESTRRMRGLLKETNN